MSRQIIHLLAFTLLVAIFQHQTRAQGVKGGSAFSSVSSNAGLAPSSAGSNSAGQSSSTFIQMFNSLTPLQQQQFIRQMSSSNRRVFAQTIPQQANNFAFTNEEVSSSSAGAPAPLITGGTKSSAFKQVQNQILSPVQQGSFFRSQQTKSVATQPTIQPASFSISRQVSSQQQQQVQPTFVPSSNSEQSFQVQRTVVNAQPQQASYFNRVQQVSQVAQPVVLPSSEQSFRRVASFSSQPLPIQQENSGFSQQFVQQQVQQAQPIQTGFNRFQQFSSSSSQPIIGAGFNQQADLQQEKVDLGSTGIEGFTGGANFGSSFESSSAGSSLGGFGNLGFESADAQQKNIQLPDDYNGLTAASINNKWYIMRPVENPSALGLGDASSSAGALRRLPISGINQAAKLSVAVEKQAKASTLPAAPAAASLVTTTSSTGTGSAKKRSAEKKKKRKQPDEGEEESSGPVSTSSSALMEPEEDQEDERRKR